jgi:hypothetical protein
MHRKHIIIGLVAMTAITVFVLPFAAGFLGHSAMRIRREHGLRLPASASHFECRGDAWLTIIDRGAASTFEMSRTDLGSFTSQLSIRSSTIGSTDAVASIFPGNSQYRVSAPWRIGTPIATYDCQSPTGDLLSVQIWPIDDSRVGVCLYTDWN